MSQQSTIDFEGPGKSKARALFLEIVAQAVAIGFTKKYYWDGGKVFGGMFYFDNLVITISPGYDWNTRTYDLHRVRASLSRLEAPVKISGDKTSRPWTKLIPVSDINNDTDIKNFIKETQCQLTEQITQTTGTKSA